MSVLPTAVGPKKEQLIEGKTSTEETNSVAITDKVPSEEEQDDRNNLLVSPYSAVLYRCPLCDDFRTPYENKMRDHIFSEQKYLK